MYKILWGFGVITGINFFSYSFPYNLLHVAWWNAHPQCIAPTLSQNTPSSTIFYPLSYDLLHAVWWNAHPQCIPQPWVKTHHPLSPSTHFLITFYMWCGGMHISSVSPQSKHASCPLIFPCFPLFPFFMVMPAWVPKIIEYPLGTTGLIKIAGSSFVKVKSCRAP